MLWDRTARGEHDGVAFFLPSVDDISHLHVGDEKKASMGNWGGNGVPADWKAQLDEARAIAIGAEKARAATEKEFQECRAARIATEAYSTFLNTPSAQKDFP